MSKTFYKIETSTDTLVAGTVPQVEEIYEYKGDFRYDVYQTIDYKANPENLPDLNRFEIQKGAKVTDVLSNSLMNEKVGLFVRKECTKVFDPFVLGASESLGATFYKGKKGMEYELIFVAEAHEAIDFKQSTFEVNGLLAFFPGEEIKFESFTAHQTKLEELVQGESLKLIYPKSLYLTETLDLFRPPATPYLVASQRLKDAIEESGMTGVEFSDLEMEIFELR